MFVEIQQENRRGSGDCEEVESPQEEARDRIGELVAIGGNTGERLGVWVGEKLPGTAPGALAAGGRRSAASASRGHRTYQVQLSGA